MAFKYLADGLIYEDRFHFRYVNGFYPPKEMIEDVVESVVEGGPTSGNEGSTMVHPTHELSGRIRARGRGRGPEWCK